MTWNPPGLECHPRRQFRGIPDLPHRSLSGQGNGAEHSGVSFCQSSLRAHLESPLCGLCNHHRRRRLSASNIAAAITTTPVRCATWCRITSCNCSVSLRWNRWSPLKPTRSAIRKWMCFTPFVRFTVMTSISASCAGNTAKVGAGGKKVPGYREEDGVAPDSQTETFAALKLFIDNWRWQDVPFYLRTGKRLTRQASEIIHSISRGAASILSG